VGFLPSWLRSSWRRGGFQQSWGALRALLVKSRKEQPGSPCLWLGLLVSPSSHRVPFSPPPAASLACLLQGGQLCVPTTIPWPLPPPQPPSSLRADPGQSPGSHACSWLVSSIHLGWQVTALSSHHAMLADRWWPPLVTQLWQCPKHRRGSPLAGCGKAWPTPGWTVWLGSLGKGSWVLTPQIPRPHGPSIASAFVGQTELHSLWSQGRDADTGSPKGTRADSTEWVLHQDFCRAGSPVHRGQASAPGSRRSPWVLMEVSKLMGLASGWSVLMPWVGGSRLRSGTWWSPGGCNGLQWTLHLRSHGGTPEEPPTLLLTFALGSFYPAS